MGPGDRITQYIAELAVFGILAWYFQLITVNDLCLLLRELEHFLLAPTILYDGYAAHTFYVFRTVLTILRKALCNV